MNIQRIADLSKRVLELSEKISKETQKKIQAESNIIIMKNDMLEAREELEREIKK